MANVRTTVDVSCPSCSASPTEIVWEPIYLVGDDTPKDYVAKGCKCPSCNLQFMTEDARQAVTDADKPEPDGDDA